MSHTSVVTPRVPLGSGTDWEPDYIKLARRLRWGYRFSARRVVKAAPEGGRLLEVGPGPGFLLAEVARLRPDLEVHGLDISARMLEHARSVMAERGLGARVHLQLGDAYEMPYPDEFFDYIFCMNTIHGMEEPGRFFREVYRVLKSGGRAQIRGWRRDVPAVVTAMGRLNTRFLRRMGSGLEGMGPVIAASYTQEEVEAVLRDLAYPRSSVQTSRLSLMTHLEK